MVIASWELCLQILGQQLKYDAEMAMVLEVVCCHLDHILYLAVNHSHRLQVRVYYSCGHYRIKRCETNLPHVIY
jgi:hypothetical protein